MVAIHAVGSAVITRVGLLLLLLPLLPGHTFAQAICTRLEKHLSTDCGSVCGNNGSLCLVYQSIKECSSANDTQASCLEGKERDGCAYECFPARAAESEITELYINSGGSEEPTTVSSAMNVKVDTIGNLTLPHVVNEVILRGQINPVDKDYIANVTLVERLIPNHIAAVTLASLNVGQQLTASVTKYVPINITKLEMTNTNMFKLQDDLKLLTSLKELGARNNSITEVPASSIPATITSLDLQSNKIQKFEADCPSMTSLSLGNNSLTAIPSVVANMANLTELKFDHNKLSEVPWASLSRKLTTLELHFNKLTTIPPAILEFKQLNSLDVRNNSFDNAVLTMEVYTYLRKFSNLRINGRFKSSCGNGHSKPLFDTETRTEIPVCVTDEATKRPLSSGAIVGIVAGVLAVILVIAVFVWRKRKSSSSKHAGYHEHHDDNTSMIATDTWEMYDTSNNSAIEACEVLRSHRLAVKDLHDLRPLGSGGYGIVWLVLYCGKQHLASKRLKKRSSEASAELLRKFVDEIRLTARLDHTNIVQFVGVAWTSQQDLQALYEYMENGDVRNWLKHQDPSIGWTKAKLQIAIDVAHALAYVHSFAPAIVHRDLKSSNVLLDKDMTAKLCDFGVARAQSKQETMTAGVGTSFWLAPEVISGRGDYGWRADIYSFGVLLSELDTHRIPYEDVREARGRQLLDVAIIHQVGSGMLTPSFSASCPTEVLKLGRWCLDFDPAKRPTAMEVASCVEGIQKSWRIAHGNADGLLV